MNTKTIRGKTLGIFLSLVLVLSMAAVMLPATPVSAAATNAKVKLVIGGSGGGNTATWSTSETPPTGYGAYAARLNGGDQTHGDTYAAVVIPMDGTVTLASITSFKYSFKTGSATSGYPHVCFYTHDPVDSQTGEITMYSGGSPLAGQTTGWNEVVVTPTSPAATGSSGFFWYGSETTFGSLTQGLPNTYTLGDFQTTADFSTHVIDKIQIEFGWWTSPPAPATTNDCWVDKLQLTAGTIFDYNLEPIAINKALYKAGETVNITVQNANASGTIPVYASSNLPSGPITIACTETGTGTGIFTGSFQLVSTTPGTGQLLVSNGNTITVSYTGDWGAGSATHTTTATYDSAAPTVALSSAAANPTNVSPFAVTATFSEAVTGFAVGDISVTNGSASTLAGGPTVYTFNVSPTSDGLVTVNIPAGGCTDLALNANTAATPLTRTYDRTAPTVTLSAAAQDSTKASPILVTASFSEAVTGFIDTDVTGSNFVSPVTSFTDVGGAHTLFTFSVTPTTDGLVTVSIAGSVCTDLALNANTAATDLTRTSDRTVPTVSITSTIGPTGSSTAETPVPFTATFSEAVTGFILSDIVVTNGTASNLVDVGDAHTVFTFDVTPTAGGAVTVSIPAGRAQDAATNNNTISTPNPFTFTFVNPNPTTTILSSVGPTGSLTNISPIPFTVNFSAAVTGFTLSDIVVTNGTASGFSGVGTTYYFNVTPASSQCAVTVNIAAGVCQDTAASRPNLAAAPFTINYDSVAPSVAITVNTGGSPWLYTFTWSEYITGFDTTCITVTGLGTAKGAFTEVTPNRVFTLEVTPPTVSGTVVTVTVPAACGVTDAATNANTEATHELTYIPSTAGTYVIYLDTGWNLISLPLIPTSTAIADVLAGITPTGKVISVWYYTGGASGTWLSYAPGGPTPDLTTMQDGKGYLINMSAPATLIVSGTELPVGSLTLPPTYNVSIGYNLIGFKSLTAMDNSVYLTGTSYRFPIYSKQAGVWQLLNLTTDDMKPGFGYWVYFNAAGTITP